MPEAIRPECADLEARLADLLEEDLRAELSADERERFLAHARSCTRCGELLDSYRSLLAGLSRLPREAVPAGFAAAVMARIEKDVSEPVLPAGPREVRPEAIAGVPASSRRKAWSALLRIAALVPLVAGGWFLTQVLLEERAREPAKVARAPAAPERNVPLESAPVVTEVALKESDQPPARSAGAQLEAEHRFGFALPLDDQRDKVTEGETTARVATGVTASTRAGSLAGSPAQGNAGNAGGGSVSLSIEPPEQLVYHLRPQAEEGVENLLAYVRTYDPQALDTTLREKGASVRLISFEIDSGRALALEDGLRKYAARGEGDERRLTREHLAEGMTPEAPGGATPGNATPGNATAALGRLSETGKGLPALEAEGLARGREVATSGVGKAREDAETGVAAGDGKDLYEAGAPGGRVRDGSATVKVKEAIKDKAEKPVAEAATRGEPSFRRAPAAGGEVARSELKRNGSSRGLGEEGDSRDRAALLSGPAPAEPSAASDPRSPASLLGGAGLRRAEIARADAPKPTSPAAMDKDFAAPAAPSLAPADGQVDLKLGAVRSAGLGAAKPAPPPAAPLGGDPGLPGAVRRKAQSTPAGGESNRLADLAQGIAGEARSPVGGYEARPSSVERLRGGVALRDADPTGAATPSSPGVRSEGVTAPEGRSVELAKETKLAAPAPAGRSEEKTTSGVPAQESVRSLGFGAPAPKEPAASPITPENLASQAAGGLPLAGGASSKIDGVAQEKPGTAPVPAGNMPRTWSYQKSSPPGAPGEGGTGGGPAGAVSTLPLDYFHLPASRPSPKVRVSIFVPLAKDDGASTGR